MAVFPLGATQMNSIHCNRSIDLFNNAQVCRFKIVVRDIELPVITSVLQLPMLQFRKA